MTLLGDRVHDASMLDLFAGSGAVGLEALSRGAATCDFVENNPAALRARQRTRIFDRDAIVFVARIDKIAYDIAFADPPYESKKLDRIVEDWLKQPFSAVLLVEHAQDHPLPAKGTRRRLGDSAVTLLAAPALR
jgi:16S rRNA (guanine966-N2)-methyltransferase